MTPHTKFGGSEVRALLQDLGERLFAKGVSATIYIIGGAAMALEFDTRRVTADIDAIFEPSTTVQDEAEAMAAERGLPHNWLNASALPWVPGDDEDAVKLDLPGIAVAVASPAHLMAMKMAAARPRDLTDLELLFQTLGITSAEEAADLVLGIYGEHSMVISSRAELVLIAREVLGRIADFSDH